jgi:predicted glycogen debranching enzyme
MSTSVRFERSICGDFNAATTREWLETNGIGGFASSTIAGVNTRRYHGLLTAATKPPLGRMLLLSKLEETLITGGQRFELSANQYSGAIHPRGYELLSEFRLDPFPIWTWEIAGAKITKTLFLVQGENSVVIEYEIDPAVGDAASSCELEVRPLIAFRDYHATTHANSALNSAVESADGFASIQPYAGVPRLNFAHNAAHLDRSCVWYYGFEYGKERERGLDSNEDLYNPFTLQFRNGRRAIVIASTEVHLAAEAPTLRKQELRRRKLLIAGRTGSQPLVALLTAAADQFIVDRGNQKSVIAGYHWFGDWGRDTMIALPGLALATGRADVAKSVLLSFAEYVSDGMLPNRFPDAGETPEYNTVDATLWFFEAIRAYAEYTGDTEFVREKLYSVLKDILDWHIRGTRFGIRVDGDGLLSAGEPGAQLTWMDAKIGDWVVTPRHGKPVEIQALWYNALRIFEAFAESFCDEEARIFTHELAELAKQSFNAKFWNNESRCLYDVVNGSQNDGAIRPNQIFTASLRYPILAEEKIKAVVDVVERELLTPYGLRTLSSRDSRYRPRYEGGVRERDSAYHQGTIWPWLLGPFITAYVKAHRRSPEARAQAERWMNAFSDHIQSAGLNQVSEILDAEPPHEPRGCIAQAWSVAELLRAAVEDIYEMKPARAAAEMARKAQAA